MNVQCSSIRTRCRAMSVMTLAAALLLTGCERDKPTREALEPQSWHEGGVAGTPPTIELVAPLPSGEWHLPGGDYASLRFSPLDQITTANVAELKQVTTLSTGIPRGHEGAPLVVNNTMYMVTPYPNNVMAIDLVPQGGRLKWLYEPLPDPRSVGIACCDVVNRGAVHADGKIVFNTLDAHTIALDAETGEELWRTRVGNIQIGETVTMAPLIVKDKVLVGNSGGELGVRGWILALDLESGREIWRAYNTGPDKDMLIGPDFKPFYAKDQGADLGARSWPGEQWRLGGSTVWGWLSY